MKSARSLSCSSALVALFAGATVGLTACDDDGTSAAEIRSGSPGTAPGAKKPRQAEPQADKPRAFGKAPAFPTGPLDPELIRSLEIAYGSDSREGTWNSARSKALQSALKQMAESDDIRLAWVAVDLRRLSSDFGLSAQLGRILAHLTGLSINYNTAWLDVTDHLIAWDVPAPPGYLELKRGIYATFIPAWEPLFEPGEIDWRHVTWGGVPIDDRPFGTTDDPCDCIPAADNPEVTDASGADWLDDDDIVFGIAVNDEYRAYPRRIMEVREMVNDTLGGRDLGIPYCTLCGSAQAYFTDQLPEDVERPILRTSGLLIRSNKVMFDLNTFSIFDTFRGNAVTGPLAERGIVLQQAGVVTTTWGAWKAAHPQTTVLAEGLALGRDFDFRSGRDAHGPIFPIGEVDPRLQVQEDVLGLITESGTPLAFNVKAARAALERGETIVVENVHVVLDGGGVRAVDANRKDLGGHQAFWFAWSQFYPDTELWPERK